MKKKPIMGNNDWKEVELEEICEISSSKRIFAKEYKDSGIPFFRGKEVTEKFKGNEISTELFISEEKYKEIKNKYGVPTENDILLTSVGTLGNPYLVKKDVKFYFKDGNLTWFRDFKNALPKYLYYWIISPQGKESLSHSQIGSTQQAYTIASLKKTEMILPPLPEQKVIAYILGSLDDKIELNHQMNKTLEEMTQAMFKSWFVDFDPVFDNAIKNGKDVPEELQEKLESRSAFVKTSADYKPLPKEIRELFPDEFEFTEEMGWVPKGWKVTRINELVDTISDTYSFEAKENVIFLNTGDILDGRFLHSNYSEISTLPGQAKKSIKKNDILYSEIRPKNKRFAFVSFDGIDHVVSTKLMVLRSHGLVHNLFTYFLLKQQYVIDKLQLLAESRSGTFPQITFNSLSSIMIPLPKDLKIIEHFVENILDKVHSFILANEKQTETLTILRDTLLPKLVSGEVRVGDKIIDKILEDKDE